MTAEDFYDRCAKHDWYYQMSDDPRKHRNGNAAQQELSRLAAGEARLGLIYAAWEAHMFSGPDFGTAAVPRPQRPLRVNTFPGPLSATHPAQLSLF